MAGKLSVEWPAPPSIQKSSHFGGFYLSPVQTVVRTRLTLYPDCVAELTASWPKPMSALPLRYQGQISSWSSKVWGKQGFIHLLHNLRQAQNTGIAGTPTLPTCPCHILYSPQQRGNSNGFYKGKWRKVFTGFTSSSLRKVGDFTPS